MSTSRHVTPPSTPTRPGILLGLIRAGGRTYVCAESGFTHGCCVCFWIRYIARKRQARCFGNHLEMQAMSELYNRNIEVYSYSLQPINIFQAATNTNEPIRLSYHGNIHYNAIFNPSRPAFGVGLGFAGLQPGAADRHQVCSPAPPSRHWHILARSRETNLSPVDFVFFFFRCSATTPTDTLNP
jgi:hypothetical protein